MEMPAGWWLGRVRASGTAGVVALCGVHNFRI
jgi:hypothetical protein